MARFVPSEDHSVFTFYLPLPSIAPPALGDPMANLQPLRTDASKASETAHGICTLEQEGTHLGLV